jgi:cysteine desulfurase
MIYLDNNSTTALDPLVLEKMLPFFSTHFGNASSKTHTAGWIAAEAVEIARQQIASLISCEYEEIIFTSGATESINIALQGLYKQNGNERKKIVSSPTEHKAVLDVLNHLKTLGAEIKMVNVDGQGEVDLDSLKNLVDENTLLVCIMAANNETGTLQNLNSIAAISHSVGAYFFCDATQAIGKMRVDVNEMGIDLMPISAHKFYGPKGVGALYIKRKNPRVNIEPISFGGGQEKNIRPGTLNVSGIVGLGAAAEIAENEWWTNSIKISKLRTFLEQSFEFEFGVKINGSIKNRLCNTTNICFNGLKADELISKLPLIAMSIGSACTSALAQPSHVLKAMGKSEKEILSSIRFSVGKSNTQEEIEEVVKSFKKVMKNINKISN